MARRPTMAMVRSAEAKAQEVDLWKKDYDKLAEALKAMETRAMEAEASLEFVNRTRKEKPVSNLEDHLREQDEITEEFEEKLTAAVAVGESIAMLNSKMIGKLQIEKWELMMQITDLRRDMALANEGREALQVMLSEEVRTTEKLKTDVAALIAESKEQGRAWAFEAKAHDVTRQAVKGLREAVEKVLVGPAGRWGTWPAVSQDVRDDMAALRHVYNATAPELLNKGPTRAAADDAVAMAQSMGMAVDPGPGPIKPPETILDVVREIRDMLRTAY